MDITVFGYDDVMFIFNLSQIPGLIWRGCKVGWIHKTHNPSTIAYAIRLFYFCTI